MWRDILSCGVRWTTCSLVQGFVFCSLFHVAASPPPHVWVHSFHANAHECVYNWAARSVYMCARCLLDCKHIVVLLEVHPHPTQSSAAPFHVSLLNRYLEWHWETGPQSAAPSVWERNAFDAMGIATSVTSHSLRGSGYQPGLLEKPSRGCD